MILAIDTSSPIVGVAVALGPKLLASRSESIQRASRELLRMIDRTLSEAKATVQDLDGLVALRGPGSFTGLRIGLATIFGLHQALEIPARGVSTLEVLAAVAEVSDQTVLAVVDAQRGEWFAQSFGGVGVPRSALDSPRCLSGQAIGELSPPIVVGHGARAALGPFLGKGTQIVDPDSLAPIALLHWSVPRTDWDPHTLTEPLYFRQAAATERRDSADG